MMRMRNYIKVLLVLFFVVIFSSSSFADKAFFIDGELLAKYYKSYTTIYNKDGELKNGNATLETIVEAMKYAGYIQAVNDTFPIGSTTFCLPEKTPLFNVCFVVGEFLMEHPEKWEIDAAYIAAEALSNKYQCKETKEAIPNINKEKRRIEF